MNQIQQAKNLVRELYKNDKGEPFELTDGQAEIFSVIFAKKYPRNHINTFTRFGKSETVSMAVLTRITTFPEKWAIVAPTKDKAKIIMSYIIKHIFDNDYTRQRFVIESGESEENIRRHRNKERLNFRLKDGTLGEVFITSAEGAMGLGASNVVEDEAALINDNYHSYVMRMLGDQTDNFLVKIGNPFDSQHFRKSEVDPRYNVIKIDYLQGIKEGRLTEEYVEEMREQPNFDVLYECKFPPADTMDDQGWVRLLSKEDIDRAMVDEDTVAGFGVVKAGADVAGGGKNLSIIVNRWTNVADIAYRSHERDTMIVAEAVINNMDKYKIDDRDGFGDSVGIGRGLCDIVRKVKPLFHAVNFATTPTTNVELYTNLRAQCFWKLREWIMGGGKLIKNNDWYQLTQIFYRTKITGTKGGKIQIMSKEEMLKRGIESPDVADALALTFVSPDVVRKETEKIEDAFFKAKMALKKAKHGDSYKLQQVKW